METWKNGNWKVKCWHVGCVHWSDSMRGTTTSSATTTVTGTTASVTEMAKAMTKEWWKKWQHLLEWATAPAMFTVTTMTVTMEFPWHCFVECKKNWIQMTLSSEHGHFKQFSGEQSLERQQQHNQNVLKITFTIEWQKCIWVGCSCCAKSLGFWVKSHRQLRWSENCHLFFFLCLQDRQLQLLSKICSLSSSILMMVHPLFSCPSIHFFCVMSNCFATSIWTIWESFWQAIPCNASRTSLVQLSMSGFFVTNTGAFAGRVSCPLIGHLTQWCFGCGKKNLRVMAIGAWLFRENGWALPAAIASVMAAANASLFGLLTSHKFTLDLFFWWLQRICTVVLEFHQSCIWKLLHVRKQLPVSLRTGQTCNLELNLFHNLVVSFSFWLWCSVWFWKQGDVSWNSFCQQQQCEWATVFNF